VSWQKVEPEECLRSAADEALRQAEGGALVLHCTLGVRAAANAFVMLGLIPERQADTILNDYQESLQARSLGTAWGLTEGELPVHSGAGDVWEAHVAGPSPLPDVPEAMVPAAVSFPATIAGLKADLRFDWVKLTQGQWRVSFRASADDPGGEPDRPSVVMREALAMLTVTDDTGHRYRPRVEGVTWERVAAGRQEWRGELVADQNPVASENLAADADLEDGMAPGSGRPAWLEIASAESGTAERIGLAVAWGTSGESAPAAGGVPVGRASPRWATPAEGYLAALAAVGGVKVGWTEVDAAKTAEIVAIVADCLLAVGALPVGSPLLRPGSPPPRPAQETVATGNVSAWQDALGRRWANRAHLSGTASAPGTTHRVLLAGLPFEHATVIIESLIENRDTGLVGVTLHAGPWAAAAPWPIIVPCLTVHATDDHGSSHEGILAGFSPGQGRLGGTAGRGTFWLWPPVPPRAGALTITVSTLWEAATAAITLEGNE
jgi:hypothetical protein